MASDEPEGLLRLDRRRLLACCAALSGVAGCQRPMTDGGQQIEELTATTDRADPAVADDTLDQLVTDTTAFALALERELQSGRSGANLFSSPYSVAVALAMTYAGARGETADEMREALRFSLSDDRLHPAFNRLTRTVEAAPETDDAEGDPFRLRVVNAIWGQRGFPFREDYLELLATHYGAGLRTVDFADDPEAARTAINTWVANQTEDRIQDLLGKDAVGPRTRLVLTNAIYFNASWKTPFDESNTTEQEFTSIDGTTATVPMMRRQGEIAFAAMDGHQAVELPYIGDSASMVIVLPKEGEFEDFAASLDRDRLNELLDGLRRSEGSLALPRFTYRSEFSLTAVLRRLGMERAFEKGAADLTGMYDPGRAAEELSIDDVIHKAFVSVDEAGTEAAAATGVTVGAISVSPGEPWEMVVDRPFLFGIRDRGTGAILFLGRVVDGGRLS